jgi:hypothetical protein
MRVRSHRVQQAAGYPGTAAVAVPRLMAVTGLIVVTAPLAGSTVVNVLIVVTVPVAGSTVVNVLMAVTVPVAGSMVVGVLIVVTARVAVRVPRAARAVHVVQHARESALPHINTYQGRALAS